MGVILRRLARAIAWPVVHSPVFAQSRREVVVILAARVALLFGSAVAGAGLALGFALLLHGAGVGR